MYSIHWWGGKGRGTYIPFHMIICNTRKCFFFLLLASAHCLYLNKICDSKHSCSCILYITHTYNLNDLYKLNQMIYLNILCI